MINVEAASSLLPLPHLNMWFSRVFFLKEQIQNETASLLIPLEKSVKEQYLID